MLEGIGYGSDMKLVETAVTQLRQKQCSRGSIRGMESATSKMRKSCVTIITARSRSMAFPRRSSMARRCERQARRSTRFAQPNEVGE